jgi:DMSO/TMAO reductase YedYZ heme-binding membrane subunit
MTIWSFVWVAATICLMGGSGIGLIARGVQEGCRESLGWGAAFLFIALAGIPLAR